MVLLGTLEKVEVRVFTKRKVEVWFGSLREQLLNINRGMWYV